MQMQHLVVDAFVADGRRLGDVAAIFELLDTLPERIGMTKIAPPYVFRYSGVKPEDWGVTGVVIIAESHISIHTFPLRGFVSADVYTCQNVLDVTRICQYFAEAFGLEDIETNVVTRGTRYPQHDIYGAPAADAATEPPTAVAAGGGGA